MRKLFGWIDYGSAKRQREQTQRDKAQAKRDKRAARRIAEQRARDRGNGRTFAVGPDGVATIVG